MQGDVVCLCTQGDVAHEKCVGHQLGSARPTNSARLFSVYGPAGPTRPAWPRSFALFSSFVGLRLRNNLTALNKFTTTLSNAAILCYLPEETRAL